ncbi:hypothetical protein D3C87_2087850 [compost metagenome]
MSEVPAPMSTRARFSARMFGGTAALMAAIGSSVRFCTSSPLWWLTATKESVTTRGKKVAISSTSMALPRWPSRLESAWPSR